MHPRIGLLIHPRIGHKSPFWFESCRARRGFHEPVNQRFNREESLDTASMNVPSPSMTCAPLAEAEQNFDELDWKTLYTRHAEGLEGKLGPVDPRSGEGGIHGIESWGETIRS